MIFMYVKTTEMRNNLTQKKIFLHKSLGYIIILRIIAGVSLVGGYSSNDVCREMKQEKEKKEKKKAELEKKKKRQSIMRSTALGTPNVG